MGIEQTKNKIENTQLGCSFYLESYTCVANVGNQSCRQPKI